MRPNVTFSLFFAGSAFVVATLTGIIAGVDFGVILLRAVIGAVVFAGLGYGAYLVVSARLPELLSAASSAQTGRENADYGQNVDIVVDDEIAAGEEESEDEEPAADLEAVDEEPGEAATEAVEAAETREPAGAPMAGEAPAARSTAASGTPPGAEPSSEELQNAGPAAQQSPASDGEEEPAPERGEPAAGPAPAGEVAELEEAEEPEEVGPVGDDDLVEEVSEVGTESQRTAKPSAKEADVDENSVDTLPDIGSFSDDFESEGTEVVEEDEGAPRGGGSSRSKGQGVEQDPEVIAKALQTVMKRDE
jgi:hypothetical protein